MVKSFESLNEAWKCQDELKRIQQHIKSRIFFLKSELEIADAFSSDESLIRRCNIVIFQALELSHLCLISPFFEDEYLQLKELVSMGERIRKSR